MEYQTIGTFIKGTKTDKLTMEKIPEYCSFSSAQLYGILAKSNKQACDIFCQPIT
jgi:hypothetical protein